MPAAPHRPVHPDGGQAPADPRTRWRRGLRLAAALAALQLRVALAPDRSSRRRQRVDVCGAARILTALGVRVRVVAPRTPWPRGRACRLVVADDTGWLGDLALVTAVPRGAEGWQAACRRALPWRGPATGEEPAAPDAVACPVALRYRAGGFPLDRPPRTLPEVLAARDLVVEVHLLPPLDLAGGVPDDLLAPVA
jgi:hypothetical protein